MLILGVEFTAHTFGCGVVEVQGKAFTNQGKILANVRDSFTSPDKGMIPNKVAGHHTAIAEEVLGQALADAGFAMNNIDFIAYSAGPGLDPALLAGYKIVTQWNKIYDKKLREQTLANLAYQTYLGVKNYFEPPR